MKKSRKKRQASLPKSKEQRRLELVAALTKWEQATDHKEWLAAREEVYRADNALTKG